MCGIAGIRNFNNTKVEIWDLKKMTDAIAHRGPDGEGQWVNENSEVGFGHRRLSIIDLTENGKQPMHYGNGKYSITFNGEIYNYKEIKNKLISKGHFFFSESDTEVLLALYHEKKQNMLDELDGMFAFAIWDEQQKTLFCARDRFGEKPFFYSYEKGNAFVFASEMKALWAFGISKQHDEQTLQNFISTGYTCCEHDYPKTFYEKIKQLDSSHYILIDPEGNIEIKKYYDIDLNNKNHNISLEEAANTFYSLLKESVNLRMNSDVPVGSSLSGGLDSSSIVLLIDSIKYSNYTKNTFSARFKDFEKDEGKFITQIIKSSQSIKANEVWPNEKDMESVFDKIIFHQEEPFASASIYAQWKVMELAKQNEVVVLLDGQGADEYLGGYLPFYSLYFNQLFFTDRKKYYKEIEAYQKLRNTNVTKYEERETQRMKAGRVIRKALGKEMPYNNNSLAIDLKKKTMGCGLKELLRYADRNSMAHSREVRLPFLSKKLVEFAFSLPDDFKLRDGWTKLILRKSMQDILPKEICWRVDKIGYEPPQKKWIESDFWKFQIEEGRKKHNTIKNSNDSSISDWKAIMLNNFTNI